jgi:hypothetical protein
MVGERKSDWDQTFSGPLSPHPRSLSRQYNPYNDYSMVDLQYWLQFAEFYQWPSVIFNNFTHLFELIRTTDFQAVSKNMEIYNQKLEKETVQEWKNTFSYGTTLL